MKIEQIYSSDKPKFEPKHLKLTFESAEEVRNLVDAIDVARRNCNYTSNNEEMLYKLSKEVSKLI